MNLLAFDGGVLYGHPGAGGTAVNGVTAALVVACLLLGRR